MNPIIKFVLSALSLVFIVACQTVEHKNTATYFGGKILNPKSDFVMFLKDDKVLNSIPLDENNRFLEKFESFEEGLYTFKHGTEMQYIYIEPRDSIWIRLNTWDFDESLVFSGKGSGKNEFLINLFLQNEKEEHAMNKFFKLSEVGFMKKIDSLVDERMALYHDFSTNHEVYPAGFKELIDAAIYLPLYRLKEVYPMYHKRSRKLDDFPSVSDQFYAHREKVQLDNSALISFYPYQNYVINYLYNLSYHQLSEEGPNSNLTFKMLNSVVDHIELEDFKNTLLKRIAIYDFLNSESTCNINQENLAVFSENCSNQQYINQVQNLVNDSKVVLKNEPLHDFDILTYDNESLKIRDVIKDRNAFIYFWSTEYMSSEYLVNRIKYFEKNYPEILFIGINLETSFENIYNEPNLKNLALERQFKLTQDSFAHTFLTSDYSHVILVNNEGIVKNGFTYLGSPKLWSELKKF
jgi:hypothetical protein